MVQIKAMSRILFVLVLLLPAPGWAEGAWAFGGDQSCATWQSDDSNRAAGDWWILGYWTGRNIEGKNGNVGATTDSRGIVAEVQVYCAQAPSASIAEAATHTYTKIRALRR